MTGYGLAPYGVAPYGVGTPAVAPIPGGKPLRDTLTGIATTSRKINPATGDYVIDAFGRVEGMTAGQQAVYLAIKSKNIFEGIEIIGSDFSQVISSRISDALSGAVSRGLISDVASTVTSEGSRGYALIRFFDETTQTEQTQEV